MGLALVLLILLLTLRFTVLTGRRGYCHLIYRCLLFLPVVDVSINFLSTFAFLLVLGIVVDDAIVIEHPPHREDLGFELKPLLEPQPLPGRSSSLS